MPEKLLITRRQFFVALLVCLAILLAVNRTVQRLTAHTVSRRVLEEARAARSARVIVLGNSLMRAGFLPEVFSGAAGSASKSPAVNLALGASSPVEQLLLLRAGLHSVSRPKLLLYGFYDFQLTDPVTFANADIIGNHDILYYQEPAFARRYFQMTRYDSATFEITRHFPMLYERGAVWAKVELLRRSLGQQGMPAESRNQFGRAGDFTLLEARNRDEFEQHCASASRAAFNAPTAEIIRAAQEREIRIVFVVMPLPPKHVRTFYDTAAWHAYQRHIQQLLAVPNVAYLDASRWITDASRFGDALHLTPQGADEFSRRLGAFCSDLKNLDACSSSGK